MGKFVELKCQNCGGQLRVDENDIKIVGECILYRSRNTLTCQSCGTQFERNADLAEDKGSLGDVIINGNGNIVVGNISNCSGVSIGAGARNISVGGSIVGGDNVTIITGDSNRVIRNR
jgi:uncharacterized Zn finger protein